MRHNTLRQILASEGLLRFGAGGIEMLAMTWNEGEIEVDDPYIGKDREPHRTEYQEIEKTFGTIREAMDWVRGWSRRLGAKDQNWGLEGNLYQVADGRGPDDERIFHVVLKWKGKEFPDKQYQKALFYLKTGRAPIPVPRIEGKSLIIDGKDGTVLKVTPGHRDSWRSWTLDRGGRKNVVVNLGDTEEDAELNRKGLDPTRASEANGIIQDIDRYTDVRDQDLQKIWKALYRGDLRGLRFASEGRKKEASKALARAFTDFYATVWPILEKYNHKKMPNYRKAAIHDLNLLLRTIDVELDTLEPDTRAQVETVDRSLDEGWVADFTSTVDAYLKVSGDFDPTNHDGCTLNNMWGYWRRSRLSDKNADGVRLVAARAAWLKALKKPNALPQVFGAKAMHSLKSSLWRKIEAHPIWEGDDLLLEVTKGEDVEIVGGSSFTRGSMVVEPPPKVYDFKWHGYSATADVIISFYVDDFENTFDFTGVGEEDDVGRGYYGEDVY